MSLKVASADGVKVYSISATRSLPEWVKEKGKTSKALKKDDEYRRRVELLQVPVIEP